MKNYEEIASRVFERRDAHAAAWQKRMKAVKKAASALSCICLIALIGIGMGVWQSGGFSLNLNSAASENAINSVAHRGFTITAYAKDANNEDAFKALEDGKTTTIDYSTAGVRHWIGIESKRTGKAGVQRLIDFVCQGDNIKKIHYEFKTPDCSFLRATCKINSKTRIDDYALGDIGSSYTVNYNEQSEKSYFIHIPFEAGQELYPTDPKTPTDQYGFNDNWRTIESEVLVTVTYNDGATEQKTLILSPILGPGKHSKDEAEKIKFEITVK